MCQRCESCGWYIYGVTSFGYKCAERNYYGVYTNIEVFEEWISEKTGKPLRKDQTCDGPKSELPITPASSQYPFRVKCSNLRVKPTARCVPR